MAGFDRSYRQKIVDEYLNDTGRNMFVPAEFLDWLVDKPEHRAYPLFFGKSDADAARQHRLDAVCRFMSGLSIKVRVSVAPQETKILAVAVSDTSPMTIKVPAFISPVADRHEGGGYVPTDVNDAGVRTELNRQAAKALRAWISRFEGAAILSGVSVVPLHEIVAALDAVSVAEAA